MQIKRFSDAQRETSIVNTCVSTIRYETVIRLCTGIAQNRHPCLLTLPFVANVFRARGGSKLLLCHWGEERKKLKVKKTDKLRSIGEQSGE